MGTGPAVETALIGQTNQPTLSHAGQARQIVAWRDSRFIAPTVVLQAGDQKEPLAEDRQVAREPDRESDSVVDVVHR